MRVELACHPILIVVVRGGGVIDGLGLGSDAYDAR
jgi:hypothetical protein